MRSEGTERRTTYTTRPKRDVQRITANGSMECQNAGLGNMEFEYISRNSTVAVYIEVNAQEWCKRPELRSHGTSRQRDRKHAFFPFYPPIALETVSMSLRLESLQRQEFYFQYLLANGGGLALARVLGWQSICHTHR